MLIRLNRYAGFYCILTMPLHLHVNKKQDDDCDNEDDDDTNMFL